MLRNIKERTMRNRLNIKRTKIFTSDKYKQKYRIFKQKSKITSIHKTQVLV